MIALQRGNSMQASQIWLNMSADDRANMSHSQGFKPATSPEEIKAKLMAQQQATGDSDLGGIETGDIDSQRIELPAVDSSGSGGLQNLPNLPSTFATGSTSVDDPR